MDNPDILSNNHVNSNSNDTGNILKPTKCNLPLNKLDKHTVNTSKKPNVPNVNVPEQILICLDVCYDSRNALYRLGDGSTFTPITMLKRVLDFFIHSKFAINKQTKFALAILTDDEAVWIQDFTNNPKDIINAIETVQAEESVSETFDFKKVFNILNDKIIVPEYEEREKISPPPYTVRMVVLYGRSNCIPLIPQDDPIFTYLMDQVYFYVDLLLAHEDDCIIYKCEEVYDALQALDTGYSFVYEISRNATKIHDCVAKLLAHPLQRPLQRNTDYSFDKKP